MDTTRAHGIGNGLLFGLVTACQEQDESGMSTCFIDAHISYE
jgi:hypothetical protein